MHVGVKIYHDLRQRFDQDTFLVDVDDVRGLLRELADRLGEERPLNLSAYCLFKNNINVELIGGEDVPLFEEDWVAVFPRVEHGG